MTVASFIHDHPEFDALLSIISDRRGVAVALVEKDYWVTHTLWALESQGLRVWFKGGTSLSKGFDLIQRFSEDLDVKLEGGELPAVTNWRSEGTKASEARQRFFHAVVRTLRIPGASVEELVHERDSAWRSAAYAVYYRSRFARDLPAVIRPFVQLEVGSARVTPGEERPITSWVHDHLVAHAPEVAVVDNRPRAIHCVHPAVTLLEKVEAISRRYVQEVFKPESFVRHYEDAAHIIAAEATASDLAPLLAEMRKSGDIKQWPDEEHSAFNPPADAARWKRLEAAWDAIAPMFWGDRIPLHTCAEEIRSLLRALP